MQNGIFNNIGSTLRDYEGNQQRGLRDLLRQASQAQEQAYTQPMPAPRQMTGVEAIVGALATILGGQQTGQGFLSGLQGGIDTENQRRQQQYEANQRASLARAQGLQQQAGLEQGFLDDFRQARQFNQRQALDRSQANDARTMAMQKMAEDRRQFDLGERNKLDLANLKGQQSTVAAANKALRDPKSTKATRMEALGILQDAGHVLPPAVINEYMNSTYYEDAQRAGAENKKASTKLMGARTATEEAMRDPRVKKILGEIETNKARAENLRMVTELMPKKLADQFRKTDAIVADTVSKIGDREFKQRQSQFNGADIRAAIGANSSQLNSLRNQKGALEKQLAAVSAKKGVDPKIIQNLRDRIASYDVTIDTYRQNYDKLSKALMESKDNAIAPMPVDVGGLMGDIPPRGTNLRSSSYPPSKTMKTRSGASFTFTPKG